MSDQHWMNWADQRPHEPRALYWWRVAPLDIGGLVVQPEWTDRLQCVGMGHADNEWWPQFSRWDGWSRTLPNGTQWRLADSADKDKVVWGIHFEPCPFCGRLPRLDGHLSPGGQGIAVTACPYEWNTFSLRCSCGMAGMRYASPLSALVKQWNTRKALGVDRG